VDFAQVPTWMCEVYPQLFAHPRLLDRLRIYAVGFEVRELLAAPRIASVASLRPLHPYRRLRQLLDGLSHLDRFREEGVL
jgi:hypothetical protein